MKSKMGSFLITRLTAPLPLCALMICAFTEDLAAQALKRQGPQSPLRPQSAPQSSPQSLPSVQPQGTPQSSVAPVQQMNGTAALKPGPVVPVQEDAGIDLFGGSVYTSGENVTLKIVYGTVESPILPNSRNRRPRVVHTIGPSDLYVITSKGERRLLGNTFQNKRVITLTNLPPGELIFEIHTFDGYTLSSGKAIRNPDKLIHAYTKSFRSGLVELWFEDAPWPLHVQRSDRNFTDALLQMRGVVADSGDGAPDITQQQKHPSPSTSPTAATGTKVAERR